MDGHTPHYTRPKDQHEAYELQQLRQKLAQALEYIPRGFADAVIAYYYEGLTMEQIGQRRGLSRERVRQLIVRGERELRLLAYHGIGKRRPWEEVRLEQEERAAEAKARQQRTEGERQSQLRRHRLYCCPCGCGLYVPFCQQKACECGCTAYAPFCGRVDKPPRVTVWAEIERRLAEFEALNVETVLRFRNPRGGVERASFDAVTRALQLHLAVS